MATARAKKLHFDVSSGLKTVLGSELITDDEVAIFELVKNSFDAEAGHVHVFFGDNDIIVADDGIGMSYEDIQGRFSKPQSFFIQRLRRMNCLFWSYRLLSLSRLSHGTGSRNRRLGCINGH